MVRVGKEMVRWGSREVEGFVRGSWGRRGQDEPDEEGNAIHGCIHLIVSGQCKLSSSPHVPPQHLPEP